MAPLLGGNKKRPTTALVRAIAGFKERDTRKALLSGIKSAFPRLHAPASEERPLPFTPHGGRTSRLPTLRNNECVRVH